MDTVKSDGLRVAIIGAGFAGLSAAVGLAKAGHQVDIFEKSAFASEIGAAINCCPNATRVLERWGFNFNDSAPTLARQGRVQLANGHVVAENHYEDLFERYGLYYLFHRVDLHSGMKDLALRAGAVIHTRSEVVELDCENGTIALKSGEKHSRDVVVVSDGVHSSFVSAVNGAQSRSERTNACIYRWLHPIDDLNLDPKTKQFVDGCADGLTVRVIDAHTRMVCYPCRNGTIMNFAVLHPETMRQKMDEDTPWDAGGDVAGLVDTVRPLGESAVAVCQKAKDIKLWPLIFREPLQKWHRGKAILIGDAAHPMLPHHGQGGCQAIEDGAALGVLLTGLKGGDNASSRLALVEKVRKSRASAIQYLSNTGQEEAGQVAAKVREILGGQDPPRTMEEVHDFNFGHDVFKASQDALEKAKQS